MESSRTQPAIAARVARSATGGIPNSITLNPLRDRSSENAAAQFLRAMRRRTLPGPTAQWEQDYRKKYAAFLCDAEAQHPLVAWNIAQWEYTPPLNPAVPGNPSQRPAARRAPILLSVTLENKDGEWVVTKYDAMY